MRNIPLSTVQKPQAVGVSALLSDYHEHNKAGLITRAELADKVLTALEGVTEIEFSKSEDGKTYRLSLTCKKDGEPHNFAEFVLSPGIRE